MDDTAMQEKGLLKADADWTYTMKREAQEIVPGLFLGPYGAAKSLEFLQKNAITDILIVRSTEEAGWINPKFPGQFEYHHCTCNDSQFENIIQYFPDVKTLIDSRLQAGKRILVHGNAGMSRSVALVIAYIMHSFAMTAEEAHHYVLQRRHCISLNDGFRSQVREYEVILKAQHRQQQMQGHNMNARNVSSGSLGGLPHSPSLKRTRSADNDAETVFADMRSSDGNVSNFGQQPQAGYMAHR